MDIHGKTQCCLSFSGSTGSVSVKLTALAALWDSSANIMTDKTEKRNKSNTHRPVLKMVIIDACTWVSFGFSPGFI